MAESVDAITGKDTEYGTLFIIEFWENIIEDCRGSDV